MNEVEWKVLENSLWNEPSNQHTSKEETKQSKETSITGIRTHEQRTTRQGADALTHCTTKEEWEIIRVFKPIYYREFVC